MQSTVKLSSGLLTFLLLLGAADAVFVEGLPMQEQDQKPIALHDEDDGKVVEQKKPTPVAPKKPTPGQDQKSQGVAKAKGPNVQKILQRHSFTTSTTPEKIILSQIAPKDQVNSFVLLKNGDRAGSIAWVSSPSVKRYYLMLKEALHGSFTPEVRDLLDETQRREGHPTRNLLTFTDPGLLPERAVFVRVRERLYEFHITEGSSKAIFNLIEDLTR